jgi:hypothetical protein
LPDLLVKHLNDSRIPQKGSATEDEINAISELVS